MGPPRSSFSLSSLSPGSVSAGTSVLDLKVFGNRLVMELSLSARLKSLEGKDHVRSVLPWGQAPHVHLVNICGHSLFQESSPFDVF